MRVRTLLNRNGPAGRHFLAVTLVLTFSLLSTVVVTAQDATPVPIATPASGQSCGERLGIGDAQVACLTFVHASQDAGLVDISVDGAVLFSGVAFGSSTGFIAVTAGAYDVVVSAASQPDAVLLESTDQTYAAGQGTEIAIVGSRESQTLGALSLPIDPVAPAAGTASLRVVLAIPDAPPVDLALSTGEMLLSGIAPLTTSDYLTVPVTSTSIEIRAAGSSDVLLPIPNFAAPDGGTVTIYALGTVTNPTGIILLSVLVPGSAGSGQAPIAVSTPVS